MVCDKIDTLRKELDKLIENGATYEEIYKVSSALDEYIIEYYLKK